jgi:DNA-binding transcriptional MerR regulator
MTVTREDLVRQLNCPREMADHRVAYWTRIGLLQPLDGQWPGTGHHRRYPDSALADVRLLALMANLGVALPLQKIALALADEQRAELRFALRTVLRLLT